MPIWEVSEPYINLWMYDEPVGYQPGIGGRLAFKLAYKQRESRTMSPNFFGMGNLWDCSWLSYIEDDGIGLSASMAVPKGGQRSYTPDNNTREFYSHTVLLRQTNNAGSLTNFVISYSDGSKDTYGFVPSEHLDGNQVALLTSKADPFGHVTSYVYLDTNSTVFLKYVIDTDGRTNTLSYTNIAYPAQITGVTDPFGRSAILRYNASGLLTNVVDADGLSSSFGYDASGWITNLTTPYGQTAFQHTVATMVPSGGYPTNRYTLLRALKVVDAAGGTNVYMLRQDSYFVFTSAADFTNIVAFNNDYANGIYQVGLIDTTWLANLFTAPPGPEILDGYPNYRLSFHWGPLQAAGLPTDVRTFQTSDLKKARIQHWLHDENSYDISQSIDYIQEPSYDGTNIDGITWFGYDGMNATNSGVREGTNSLPATISRLAQDGSDYYIWYIRDPWGRPTNVIQSYSAAFETGALARTNKYVYSTNDVDLLRIIGPRGETVAGFAYDSHHDVTAMTNALGEVTTFTYDAAGRLTSTRTPAGLTTTNIYFGSGQYTNWVQTAIDLEIKRTNTFAYTNDLVSTNTDERGLTTVYTYDNLQRPTRVDFPDGTFITNTFDKLDLVKSVDRMGYSTSYGYDAVRRMIAKTNALGEYMLFNYCTCGALESVQDAAGNLTQFFYDNEGRLVRTLYADGYMVTNHYGTYGALDSESDSAGATTSFYYTTQGLRSSAANAMGTISSQTFDDEDRLTNSIDVDGVAIANTYDLLGRLTSRSYPDGGVETFGYTPGEAAMTSYTNQVTNVVRYAYDPAGRRTNEIHTGISTNAFTYSAAGDLLILVDGRNDTTTWKYDQFGRVTNKLDNFMTNLFFYGYDPDDRLTNRVSAAKGTTTYNYDALGNLTNVSYPTSHSISLRYDALNRLTNMLDGVGTTVYSYDAVGQLLNEDGPWNDDMVSYTYNNRRRGTMSVQGPNASPWGVTYAYDAGNRLTNVTSPAGAFGYGYLSGSASSLTQFRWLPNGSYDYRYYDSVARVAYLGFYGPNPIMFDTHQYSYNVAGQRTEEMFDVGNTMDYTYDGMGQLQTAVGKEFAGTGGANRWQEQFGYAYDPAGNLAFRTNYSMVQAFGVNALNELTNRARSGALTVSGSLSEYGASVGIVPVYATNVAVSGTGLSSGAAALYVDGSWARTNATPANGTNTYTAIANDIYGRSATNSVTAYLPSSNTFAYDLNGNLLSDGTRTFAYDDENQLVSVWATNGWRSDFVYDGKMRRRIRREFTWNGSGWIQTSEVHYLYDGNLVVQERDTNNLPQVTYTRGNDLSHTLQGAGGIDGLLARTSNPQFLTLGSSASTAFYHADANGNITCLVNASNTPVALYKYDPYGNLVSQSGSLAEANLYRSSSKEFHPRSGLIYYLYRYYEPNLQRWISRDPIGEIGGFNLYAFVNNNPCSENDSTGLDPTNGPPSNPPSPLPPSPLPPAPTPHQNPTNNPVPPTPNPNVLELPPTNNWWRYVVVKTIPGPKYRQSYYCIGANIWGTPPDPPPDVPPYTIYPPPPPNSGFGGSGGFGGVGR